MCVIITYSYICVSGIKLFLYINLQTLAENYSWPENLMHNNTPMKTDADGLTISTEAQHQTPHQQK